MLTTLHPLLLQHRYGDWFRNWKPGVSTYHGSSCHGPGFFSLYESIGVYSVFGFQDPAHGSPTGKFYPPPKPGDSNALAGAANSGVVPSAIPVWDPNQIYCFNKTVQVNPGGSIQSNDPASLGFKILKWASTSTVPIDGCGTDADGDDGDGGGGVPSSAAFGVRVVIVNRRKSRRIGNVDELATHARTINGVGSVAVVELEALSLKEQ